MARHFLVVRQDETPSRLGRGHSLLPMAKPRPASRLTMLRSQQTERGERSRQTQKALDTTGAICFYRRRQRRLAMPWHEYQSPVVYVVKGRPLPSRNDCTTRDEPHACVSS
ncbi:hypothetical protein N657DRAFT_432197 [Parathielavia appendiculata]|uniref:Uncharacterized protein n=1 Tax=Parathielavia appendiculata TaxID=2587402 RepID=A0AAN6Z4J5_9PEZI|nr:hypothetical protein N657DRAFT_432197 [Parathielavia appendiculata]